jgi:Mn-dependent DtxR family transcriptional regulator
MSMSSKGHTWTHAGAMASPLVRYLNSIQPAGTLFHIDTEHVARRMGWKKSTTIAELRELQSAGALRYYAEMGSRDVAVRVNAS